MNVSITPFKAHLHESYLYDGDVKRTGVVEVMVIGASAYPGCFLTFHVLVDGRYLFSDIPLIALQHKVVSESHDMGTLSYKKIQIGSIETFEFEHMRERAVSIFIKSKSVFVDGTYMMSFDFYDENEMFHLIQLKNGQFMLAPNHKINWIGEHGLSDYKKNHTDWSK